MWSQQCSNQYSWRTNVERVHERALAWCCSSLPLHVNTIGGVWSCCSFDKKIIMGLFDDWSRIDWTLIAPKLRGHWENGCNQICFGAGHTCCLFGTDKGHVQLKYNIFFFLSFSFGACLSSKCARHFGWLKMVMYSLIQYIVIVKRCKWCCDLIGCNF